MVMVALTLLGMDKNLSTQGKFCDILALSCVTQRHFWRETCRQPYTRRPPMHLCMGGCHALCPSTKAESQLDHVLKEKK